MKKQWLLSFLALSLVLGSIVTRPTRVYAEDFEGNESYYYELCGSSELTNSEIQICRDFRRYLQDKQASLDDTIAQNKKKIESLNLEINDIYILMSDVKKQINQQEDRIDLLQAEIVRLEGNIATRDDQIRERMYVMQSSINSNMYLSYLMGSSSIDDFYSRMTSIDELTEYDRDLIRGLKEDKEQVVENKKAAETEKLRLDELVSQYDGLISQLSSQIREFETANAEAEYTQQMYDQEIGSISDAIQNAINNNESFIDGPSTGGSGWSLPCEWGIVTSAGTEYTDGGTHIALDVGGIYGSDLYAPCDAVVIYVGTGCASDGGYLGNYCNGGAGNYMVMLTRMNGTTYGFRYLHTLNENYVGWSNGQFVEVARGQVIGHMGHSGSSTGTHLHTDIFNLGDISYEQAYAMFASYGSKFGTRDGYGGVCGNTGTPCREIPSELYGYSLYQEIGSR